MTDSLDSVPPAPQSPLFSIDLGENGGTLAPTSPEALVSWLQKEQESWQWLAQIGFGNAQRLGEGYSILSQSLSDASQAHQYWVSNNQHARGLIENAKSRTLETFTTHKLAHSSTPQANRIHAYAKESGPHAASFFAAALTEPPQSAANFQPHSFMSMRGAVEGIVERYQLATAIPKGRKTAADKSFEDLRVQAERLVGEKTQVYDALHQQFETLAGDIGTTSIDQAQAFTEAQAERAEKFGRLTEEHARVMEVLQRTFREEMALRAPAEYWRTKQSGHRIWACVSGFFSFSGITGAATWLGIQIHDVLSVTKAGEVPPTWRIALLAMIGVFSVWALRLLVRMFLSHLHLLSDAGERVVMVQTYLSLLEGKHVVGEEDRRLILQALFRPASDGIVKDEGVPLSIAEFLTKTGK